MDWVKNKLRSLRNGYTKVQKAPPSGNARRNPSKRTAWLLNKLQFLEQYDASRSTTSNLNEVFFQSLKYLKSTHVLLPRHRASFWHKIFCQLFALLFCCGCWISRRTCLQPKQFEILSPLAICKFKLFCVFKILNTYIGAVLFSIIKLWRQQEERMMSTTLSRSNLTVVKNILNLLARIP